MSRGTRLHGHATRLRGLDCRRVRYAVALLMLTASVSAPSAAIGVEVVPADRAVEFDQVDFRFQSIPDEEQTNSNWGRLEVAMAELEASTGMASGYLNVYTETGWIVQNLWVNVADPFPTVATYFDLGVTVGTNVTQLSAYVDFSASPTVNFADGPRAMFDVGVAEYNAQGAGHGHVEEIGTPPPANAATFTPSRADFVISLPNLSNEQTAMNQCVPMAIANSLQYLEDRFGILVPQPHTLGLKGDGTLVGHLDTAMDRKACTPIVGNQCTCQNDPPTRTDGCGVTLPEMFDGKFAYLAANNLTNALSHKHQGYGFGGGQDIPVGNYSRHGSTSVDESVNGQVTWEWIRDELANGEDVELTFSHSDGAHCVRIWECGQTGGTKWLGYAHDSEQTPEDPGDNQGLETVQANVLDANGDGVLELGTPTWEIRFALSESPKPTVSCDGTESGGTGVNPCGAPLRYAYPVTDMHGSLTDLYIGTGAPGAYTNICMPPEWVFAIIPNTFPIGHNPAKTPHGFVSPNPSDNAPWVIHFSGPAGLPSGEFTFGFDHPWDSHNVGWRAIDGSGMTAEDWSEPVGLGKGPVHGPLLNDVPVPGACCDTDDICTNGLIPNECLPPRRFQPDTICDDGDGVWEPGEISPLCGQGACCAGGGALCTEGTEAACGGGDYYSGEACGDEHSSPCGIHCPPINDNCADEARAVNPLPYTSVGRYNDGATDVGCINLGPAVWEAFSFTGPDCQDVIIDFCGTDPAFGSYYAILLPTCDCTLTDDYVYSDSSSTADRFGGHESCCLDDPPGYDTNVTIKWEALPAGTWHYPVPSSTAPQAWAWGEYQIHIKAVPCGYGTCGDSNGNGITDLRDYEQFQLCLDASGPGMPYGTDCALFDDDEDGDVDLRDFWWFQQCFNSCSTCPVGGIAEDEQDICSQFDTTVNNTCSNGEATDMTCGSTRCGTAGSYRLDCVDDYDCPDQPGGDVCRDGFCETAGGYDYYSRDVDWYEVTTTVPDTQITWSVSAEFPVLAYMTVDPDCSSDPFPSGGEYFDTCSSPEISLCAAEIGTYYFMAASAFLTGDPSSQCGSAYTVTVECETPCPEHACCLPDETCVVADNRDCEIDQGGVTQIEDTCDDVDCTIEPPCTDNCPPGGIAEGELEPSGDCIYAEGEYTDLYNSGCSEPAEVFFSIVCGDTICGDAGSYSTNGGTDWDMRDTDWYELSLIEGSYVSWTMNSLANGAEVFLIDLNDGCAELDIVASDSNTFDECSPVTAEIYLGPGRYAARAGFGIYDDTAGEGTLCGSAYVAELTCVQDGSWLPTPSDDCDLAPVIAGSGIWEGTFDKTLFPGDYLVGGSGFCDAMGPAYEADAWWRYVAPCSGRVRIETCASTLGTVDGGSLRVWVPDDQGAPSCIDMSEYTECYGRVYGGATMDYLGHCSACADDLQGYCDDVKNAELVVDVVAGDTYYIQAGTIGAQFGVLNLEISECVDPCP